MWSVRMMFCAFMLCTLFIVENIGHVHAESVPDTIQPSGSEHIMYDTFQRISHDISSLPKEMRQEAIINGDLCKTFTYGVNGRTYAGTWQFTFSQHVGWCYNGWQVTYHSVWHTYSTSLGWSYQGISSQSNAPGPNQSFWQDTATAKFSYCAGPVGCLFDRYPWVNTVVRGDGSYGGSGGGGDGIPLSLGSQ
ncbi:MAG: hypothetical protein GFH27_549283n383 [Chloroflexi bacterium AL-W]|nr:hypothetical protein [Chloroflexi bacterium AL-N1]NOK64495.1 hypothetical protein [Chloroflexi bacterium AL-N10]NOK75737.1 hypothetical protein [Chloroflexi bacterium AL-N5]NOK80504.1 hypothetical protein [Chloroflexi bacterium AL-W]NOK87018.1 hypothetical protein [Chloroflexi bacterium AL-N15]